MKTLIERSLCVGVLAVASCAPTAGEQAQQPARAHAQTARALVGNLRRTEAPQPQQMAEYVGRYSAATGRITFEPLLPQGSGGLPRPGYTQLLSNTVSLRDNGTTVEAGGSFNGGETCGAGQVCAVVTLTNDSTRTIENLRVEIVSLTAGASVANSQPAGTGYPSSAGTAGGWNYAALLASGSESAAWRFNTGGVDFTFSVRVWGTYTRTGFSGGSVAAMPSNAVTGDQSWSDATPAWRNACLFGTVLAGITASNSSDFIEAPFPFTLNDTTIDIDNYGPGVEVSSLGTISISGVNLSGTALNYAVTDSRTPEYTIFPYWSLLTAANGRVCYGVDPTSAAPSRRLVITWENMSFASDANTRLTFSAVLQEQTDNIFFLYHRWSAGSSASNCSSSSATRGLGTATIGVRGNGAGVTASAGYNTQMLPNHGIVCPGGGAFYKITATPANP